MFRRTWHGTSNTTLRATDHQRTGLRCDQVSDGCRENIYYNCVANINRSSVNDDGSPNNLFSKCWLPYCLKRSDTKCNSCIEYRQNSQRKCENGFSLRRILLIRSRLLFQACSNVLFKIFTPTTILIVTAYTGFATASPFSDNRMATAKYFQKASVATNEVFFSV